MPAKSPNDYGYSFVDIDIAKYYRNEELGLVPAYDLSRLAAFRRRESGLNRIAAGVIAGDNMMADCRSFGQLGIVDAFDERFVAVDHACQ